MVVLGGGRFLMSEVPLYMPAAYQHGSVSLPPRQLQQSLSPLLSNFSGLYPILSTAAVSRLSRQLHLSLCLSLSLSSAVSRLSRQHQRYIALGEPGFPTICGEPPTGVLTNPIC
jgi:hypothetical protein